MGRGKYLTECEKNRIQYTAKGKSADEVANKPGSHVKIIQSYFQVSKCAQR